MKNVTMSLLAVASLVLTGCATDNTSSAGAGSEGAGESSIKVGGILTKTSATGYSTGDDELGARARFTRANAEGGVHGRTIDFIGAEDDGLDPAKGAAAARKLVQKDKVFAVVPVSAPAFGGAAFLEQSGVPWFGWATGPFWCGTKTGFGFNGCLAPAKGAGAQTWWGNQIAAQLGGATGKTAWIQGTDSTASKTGVGTISQSFTAAGFTLSGTGSNIPALAPPQDWLPYVNKIMKSDKGGPPDVVVSIMAGGKFHTGLYAALKRAGYKGAITDATSYDPKAIADPRASAALDGVYAAPQFEPFESDNAEVARMKADIAKVAPAGTPLTQHMATGYWSADVFLKVLERAGKDLTRASFLKAADGFSYENAGFGKVAYPKDKTEPNGCGALVHLQGGRFTVVQHLKCFANTPLK